MYQRILQRLRRQHVEAILHELSADLDAAHGVPVISCGVVGHAPDCECATL